MGQVKKESIDIATRAEEHAKELEKKCDVKAVRIEIERYTKNLKVPEIKLPKDAGEELQAIKQMVSKFNAIDEQIGSLRREMRELEDTTKESIDELKLNKWDHRKGRQLEEELAKVRKEVKDSNEDISEKLAFVETSIENVINEALPSLED